MDDRSVPDFRAGDRVVVAKKVYVDGLGWNDTMTEAIGRTFTIKEIVGRLGKRTPGHIRLEEIDYMWPAESLVFSKEMHARVAEQIAKDPERITATECRVSQADPPSALSLQISGDHYKGTAIQPIEFIHANGIPFAEGCVIKYVSRWRKKGGIKDLEKARHFIDILIELETKQGTK